MRDVAFRHAIVDTLQYLTSTKMYGVYTPTLNGNRFQLCQLESRTVRLCPSVGCCNVVLVTATRSMVRFRVLVSIISI